MASTVISKPGEAQVLDVLGPTVEMLAPPASMKAIYCVMRGVLPPGGVAPLHSHPDDESFYQLSGTTEVWMETPQTSRWRVIEAGDFVHVPAGVKHAWRNISSSPAVLLITCTARLGRFFLEIGRPMRGGEPAPKPDAEAMSRLAQTAASHGHWLASPEENAAIGLRLPG